VIPASLAMFQPQSVSQKAAFLWSTVCCSMRAEKNRRHVPAQRVT
jgi:hypothetical protein